MPDKLWTEYPDPDQISTAMATLGSICRVAWQEKLMPGWSGNASIRLAASLFMITATQSPKGRLADTDFTLAGADGYVTGKKKPSTEAGLHLKIYGAVESCGGILHTHPKNLQALWLTLHASLTAAGQKEILHKYFLNIGLYEAETWRKKLYFAPAAAPGSEELASGAAEALTRDGAPELPCAIWLPDHGLCALGASLEDALCVTEELEHLASVQLACLGVQG